MENETPKTQEKKVAPKQVTEAYFFAGGGEYEPITIEAASITEATEIWETKKKSIHGETLSKEN